LSILAIFRRLFIAIVGEGFAVATTGFEVGAAEENMKTPRLGRCNP